MGFVSFSFLASMESSDAVTARDARTDKRCSSSALLATPAF